MPKRSPLLPIVSAGVAAGLLMGAGGYLLLAHFRPSDPTLIRSIDLENVNWLMNGIGVGDTDYDLRLTTCEIGESRGCTKIILSSRLTALASQSEPANIANDWNAAHNVGRVYATPAGLVFTIDIDIYGGVSPTNIQAQIRSWFHDLDELRRSLAG
jgi:hypothetical protein